MAVIPILNNNLKGLYNFHMDYLSVSYWSIADIERPVTRRRISLFYLEQTISDPLSIET